MSLLEEVPLGSGLPEVSWGGAVEEHAEVPRRPVAASLGTGVGMDEARQRQMTRCEGGFPCGPVQHGVPRVRRRPRLEQQLGHRAGRRDVGACSLLQLAAIAIATSTS